MLSWGALGWGLHPGLLWNVTRVARPPRWWLPCDPSCGSGGDTHGVMSWGGDGAGLSRRTRPARKLLRPLRSSRCGAGGGAAAAAAVMSCLSEGCARPRRRMRARPGVLARGAPETLTTSPRVLGTLSPPQQPHVLSCRRSQVIEKFEALDIEKAEHMETNASAGPSPSSDTRQGRSEKRAFPRKRVRVRRGAALGPQAHRAPLSSSLVSLGSFSDERASRGKACPLGLPAGVRASAAILSRGHRPLLLSGAARLPPLLFRAEATAPLLCSVLTVGSTLETCPPGRLPLVALPHPTSSCCLFSLGSAGPCIFPP